jgi:hypothetical protein
VPSHLILHMFKACLDDFSGINVDNLAMLLEGCGRFLLRSEETSERFSTMVLLAEYLSNRTLMACFKLELMRRKQSMQHFDQRQLLLLENAYYQVSYMFIPFILYNTRTSPMNSAILPSALLDKKNREPLWSYLSVT